MRVLTFLFVVLTHCAFAQEFRIEGDGATLAVVRDKLSKAGPAIELTLRHKRASSLYWYTLTVSPDGGTDQVLIIRNGDPIIKKSINLTDLNADGFVDIMIAAGKDHRGKTWYKSWLYDKKLRRFVWIGARENKQQAEPQR